MSGFKTFLLRGNLVDLAVGIVIGIAFGAVIAAFVKDLITPIIAALFGKPDFSSLYFTVNNSRFMYGDFLNALLAFVIVAAVLYLFVVVPYARFRSRFEKAPAPEPEKMDCPRCLSSIPVGATRCAFCAIDLAVAQSPMQRA
jgi:large conductance mechanosensitive channel